MHNEKCEQMLYVRQSDFQAATGLSPRAVQSWLKNMPSKLVRGVKWYALPDIIATMGRLKGKYAHAALTLLDLAQHDEREHFVGDDGDLPATEALERFIAAYVDGGAERLIQVRKSFFYGLGLAFRSSAMMTDAERLRLLVARHAGCLRYVLSSDSTGLPICWPTFARQFSLIHAASPLTSEYLEADA